MSEPNMSTATDWYCTKARVGAVTGRSADLSEITDYVMDISYKWVNGELRTENIDHTDPDITIKLKGNDNIEQAQLWYAADLMTNVISGNQHHGRILPDGVVASQSFAQGDVSMTYHKADPDEHTEEKSQPTFYFRAQRALKRFFKDLQDSFTTAKTSKISRKNTLMEQQQTDFAARLFARYDGSS